MPGSSLFPVLALEVPDLASSAWIDVVRRVLTRAREIEDQRMNYPEITDRHHDDWDLLHRFEYQHFYRAWVAVAFRQRAYATHSQDYTALFQRTRGTSQDEDMFREDDELFGFFMKGLSALESFAYSLYALGRSFARLRRYQASRHRRNSPCSIRSRRDCRETSLLLRPCVRLSERSRGRGSRPC
jgi:hypothetical protein